MTMEEMARQENLAMKRHWTMPHGEYGARDDVEIAAYIPESWYGPEKKPSPLLGRARPDLVGKYCRRKKPCSCSQCN